MRGTSILVLPGVRAGGQCRMSDAWLQGGRKGLRILDSGAAFGAPLSDRAVEWYRLIEAIDFGLRKNSKL